MNFINRGQRPALRPLPGEMPEYIAVELHESEYKGQIQLVARYRLYDNGLESDYFDLVVNIPRYLRPWPKAGERWWIKPTALAPQKRLVFAEAYGRVLEHIAPLTVRTGEELVHTFEWSRDEGRYLKFLDGWTVTMHDAHGICRGESWRVRVTQIDPRDGWIGVTSVGPHPKMFYEPPAQVGLMSVIPIFGKREVLESDVFCYRRVGWKGRDSGGAFAAQIEHKGHIFWLECSELRKVPAGFNKDGKAIEKVVGLVSANRAHGYLAEFVLVEGETVQKPQFATFEPHLTERSIEESDPLDERDDDWREEYYREERENSEPPDYDYC